MVETFNQHEQPQVNLHAFDSPAAEKNLDMLKEISQLRRRSAPRIILLCGVACHGKWGGLEEACG